MAIAYASGKSQCVSVLFSSIFPNSHTVHTPLPDVHVNRHKKDAEIGILIGFSMIGMSGGGIAAILMEETGLFSPLFVGAALNLVSFVFSYFFLLEPDTNIRFDEEVDDDDEEPPEKVHTSVLLNVIFGALFDNVGSSGL